MALGSVRAASALEHRAVEGRLAGLRGDFARSGEEPAGAILGGAVDFRAGGDGGGARTGGAPALGAGAKEEDGPHVSVPAAGLCMSVPAAADNLALRISPESFAPPLDHAALRIRAKMSSGQPLRDAIPFWNFLRDNFHASGAGNTLGGEARFLDVAGGVNGVRRPEARSPFEVWFVPNAADTPRCRDPVPGAFAPEAGAANDLRVAFRTSWLHGEGGGRDAVEAPKVKIETVRLRP